MGSTPTCQQLLVSVCQAFFPVASQALSLILLLTLFFQDLPTQFPMLNFPCLSYLG